MISRKTTLGLAQVYTNMFTGSRYDQRACTGYRVLRIGVFHDFLFERDYPGWICSRVQSIEPRQLDAIKVLITEIHAGDAFVQSAFGSTPEERRNLGQQYLLRLAVDFLNFTASSLANLKEELDVLGKAEAQQGILSKVMSIGKTSSMEERIQKLEGDMRAVLRSLELDGYTYRNAKILAPENDVLDVEEEVGVLESLYSALHLNNRETTFHCLTLSENHYLDGNWDDSVSNSRRFLESVLREIAALHSLQCKRMALSQNIYDKPVRVRDYLENEGLIETSEKEALAKMYGLLSSVGSHPYIAQSDQARLLRNLGVTIAQFVLLRLQGCMSRGCP